MRHQRALDVSNHLLRRELRGRQNMYLLHRAALALYDLCGDYPRKREDQLLSTLDRKYAAGDVVQDSVVRDCTVKTGGQYYGRLTLNQAKKCTALDSPAKQDFTRDNYTGSGSEVLCLFRIRHVLFRVSA